MFLKTIIKLLLMADNILYSLIGKLSVIYEKGIHPKHRLINYHKFFLDRINNGERVLDIGCGNGNLSFDIAKKAGFVTGIDIRRKNIERANKRFKSSNIKYICDDALNFKPENTYDIIVLSNVLEHIEKRVEFLKIIKQYAGKILVRVPSIEREWMSLYKKELNIDYRLDKTHYIEYTMDALRNEFGEAGLVINELFVNYGEIYAVAGKNT